MPNGTNPWVTPEVLPEIETAPAEPPGPTPTGPDTPQKGVPEPDRVDRLPIYQQSVRAPLWVVGTHGGAGESEIAALGEGWRESDHAWPLLAVRRTPVLLTARTHMAGLKAAQHALTQWASGQVPEVRLLGLVMIADAPRRLPKPLREFAGVVGGGAPRAWHVPWIEEWRLGGEPVPTPRVLAQLVKDVGALLSVSDDAPKGRK